MSKENMERMSKEKSKPKDGGGEEALNKWWL